jgi:hypothetical protein
MARQWADGYGSQWYRHYDGRPPHDSDDDYRWNGTQWILDNDYEWDNLDLDEYEEERRRKIAERNEY